MVHPHPETVLVWQRKDGEGAEWASRGPDLRFLHVHSLGEVQVQRKGLGRVCIPNGSAREKLLPLAVTGGPFLTRIH